MASLYREVRAASDPAAGHELWIRGRDTLFREHPASPIPPEHRASFAGLSYARYDPSLRFEAPVETDVPPEWIDVSTGTDGIVPFQLIGRVRLPVGDLDVWWLDSYGGGIFVPMKDASCGASAYGGGRYVLDTVKGADLGGDPAADLVVDLNFAYNPSCAYTESWACPLPPPGNTLPVAIRAGELVPRTPGEEKSGML
ncbi:DUF1684 domain-containing protein [Phytoactinopolyspora halophila]|uniref:DUF1684 domain-containing protein n=1 Tax=Phytoactinopolyspora halophila TaxID=1981511 RepID=UPI001B8BC5CC|nr:DUF1684 domain-containing protein [Phytoactinopolyspora halophila]